MQSARFSARDAIFQQFLCFIFRNTGPQSSKSLNKATESEGKPLTASGLGAYTEDRPIGYVEKI